MIGRLLASAAFAVALTGTAMAQMSAPPSSSPSANDTSHATGAPTVTAPSQSPTGQSPTGQPTMGQRAMQDMKDAGHKVKSAFTGDKSKSSGMSASKQTAQGHAQDNVADKLNACEGKPMSERQSCIDAATRM